MAPGGSWCWQVDPQGRLDHCAAAHGLQACQCPPLVCTHGKGGGGDLRGGGGGGAAVAPSRQGRVDRRGVRTAARATAPAIAL